MAACEEGAQASGPQQDHGKGSGLPLCKDGGRLPTVAQDPDGQGPLQGGVGAATGAAVVAGRAACGGQRGR